ncbi:MAG: ABC transporter ATP-binding protein [Candidatus Bathyarchaeota archaeon]|nr:ABC transporter ATP-binding protein [Chloroflexota bacterium]MCL5877830.1 ABC transporter ATP-binding protein [Candidatus Bathyarchaeota archaeon]
MQNENAIQAIDLTKTFKIKSPPSSGHFVRRKTLSVNAVDNLNLSIKKGQLFGLLGPNGAGKTTLVKMLCTLLPPDSGTATVNGYDIVKQPMQVKRSLGTLFSVGERGFFWRLNGYRNLEFFAAIYNVPRQKRQERIMDVLKLVGLEGSAFDLYQRYSGGMKRKLALARTLLADPPILLLDEPTVGLDVISSRNIREFVRNTVKETGKTILYTTHYIEEAANICDQIGILRRGRLIACDTPNAIRAMIKQSELVYVVVEEITSDQIERMRSLPAITSLTENDEYAMGNQRGFCLELRSVDQVPAIFDFLFKEKIKLVNFRREEPTLEDAFIELTGRP